MQTVVITPPEPLLTPDEVRRRLGVADDDFMLEALISAAQRTIEPPVGHYGRAFGLQTLEVSLDHFPYCWEGTWGRIRLPYPPLVSIVSVKYLDTSGVEQTVDPSNYSLTGFGGAGQIAPFYGMTWPDGRWTPGAVRIRFQAGYQADDSALAPVKQALLVMIGHLRSVSKTDLFLRSETIDGVGSQEWVLSDVAGKLVEQTAEALLAGYKVQTI